MFVQGASTEQGHVEKVPALVSSSPEVGTRVPNLLPAFVFEVSAGAGRR
jgi:hypothetical protein